MTLPQFAALFDQLSMKADEIKTRADLRESRESHEIGELAEVVRRATAAMANLVDEITRRTPAR